MIPADRGGPNNLSEVYGKLTALTFLFPISLSIFSFRKGAFKIL